MKLRFPLAAAALAALVLVIPAHAEAQARARGRVVVAPRRPAVVVGVGIGAYPYYGYRPYFYDPFLFPYGWYPDYRYQRYYDDSASLRVQVTPRDAEVFVDGYFAGRVDDFDGTFQRLHLEPGEHEVQIYAPGYRTFAQRIYLQPTGTFTIRETLQQLAPGEPDPGRPIAAPPATRVEPPQARAPRSPRAPRAPRAPEPPPAPGDARDARPNDYGTLAIRVQPGDATVLIDGERWEGPEGDERLLVQLAPGTHALEVRKDGYRGYVTEITVRAGQTTPLNIALSR